MVHVLTSVEELYEIEKNSLTWRNSFTQFFYKVDTC